MIVVDWGNADESLLIMKFIEKWTLEEYQDTNYKAYDMINQQSHPVVVIVDMRQSDGTPRGFLHASHQFAKMRPAHMLTSVVLADSAVWKTLWQTAIHLYGAIENGNITFVDTVDKAYKVANDYLMDAK